MGLQYRKRIQGPRVGPLKTWLNLSLSWPPVSVSFRWNRVTANTRGRWSLRGPRGWSWRGGN